MLETAMGRIRHVHFVGIGGVGMAGIAEVLLSQGYQVSGSDLSSNALTKRLESMGATLYQGHDASHILQADVLVRSTAVREDNVELVAARHRHVPVVPRAEMLGELMRFRYGIAIAGTHGKTTTTSLVASILAEEGFDPTFVIGGKLNSAGTTARLGSGQYLVAEACESDASFLYLKPMMSVVTNIDEDHMETYNHDFNQLQQTFLNFLQHLPFYGLAVLCIDDPVLTALLPRISRPLTTYGFQEEADYRAVNVMQRGMRTEFVVKRPQDYQDLVINMQLPGRHNVLNALAAIAVATHLRVSDGAITRALEQFAGIGRRFQLYHNIAVQQGTITMVDDYGHHPREIEVTLEAARQSWPEKRIIILFQPHRFTRTRDLFNYFATVLSKADHLILLPVYSAGENPIVGADSAALLNAIRPQMTTTPILVENPEELSRMLNKILKDGDILIAQGAGNISAMMQMLIKKGIPSYAD